jgi:glycosyltransferase involved in cell wall biosynthesis
MRIAWTGSAVGDLERGSLAALGCVLLAQLLEQGIDVDLYYPGTRAELPASVRDHPNLVVVGRPVRFKWGRWYSRNRVSAFLVGLAARSLTQVKLGSELMRNHSRRPYDCVFQFSQLELFVLGRAVRRLPPIVVHPCTTASRELLWHRRESRYALQSESLLQHYVVRTHLEFRTRIQRHEVQKPQMVVGPSQTFNRLISEDYGIDPSRTRVLRHPVDGHRFADVQRPAVDGRSVVLLFVSRLSARKGLELIVRLSHRLADLAGQVEIKVLGAKSLWSDYTAHLKELNPALAEHIGEVSPADMPEVYAGADLLLVPSHYEPGSLVVGEALSSGLPIVASDQVGPVEVVDRSVCRVFRDGDLDGFEREVRRLVREVQADEGALAHTARREAQKHFSAHRTGDELIAILEEVASGRATEVSTRRFADAPRLAAAGGERQ